MLVMTLSLFRCPAGPGGGDRIRTDDPLVANQVLYQLSYAPCRESWWACADLNRGPPAYQADALNQLSYKPQDWCVPPRREALAAAYAPPPDREADIGRPRTNVRRR